MSNCGARFGLAACMLASALGHAADGDLDAAFGTAGKVQLGPSPGNSSVSPVANDVVIQPDGKTLVVGYETFSSGGAPFEVWRLTRLNVDGSPDTSFAGGGTTYINGDATPTRAQSVALRADGRSVVAGSITAGSRTLAVVYQLLASGNDDPAFNTGHAVVLTGANPSDSIFLSRVVIDTDGSIDVAGTYYASATNSYEFYFDRIAADGSSDEPFVFQFGAGSNQDAHGLDMAIDRQGRYVVVGYAPGAAGYDCAAIRITRDLYDVDRTFGYRSPTDYGYQLVPFDEGSDDNDFCDAVALFPNSGAIVIGGHADASLSSGTYQVAVLAALDDSGNQYKYESGGIHYDARFVFSYSLNPANGQTNQIARLIVDDYDTQHPQLLAIGTGNQFAPPPGPYFGIARLNSPTSSSNFSFDANLNGKGVMGVYFAQRPTGLGNYVTTNYGLSGAFANGKLVAAGYTAAAGGNNIAVTRLAAFDGIFRNGFDLPSF